MKFEFFFRTKVISEQPKLRAKNPKLPCLRLKAWLRATIDTQKFQSEIFK
jgi:hypothetical protein